MLIFLDSFSGSHLCVSLNQMFSLSKVKPKNKWSPLNIIQSWILVKQNKSAFSANDGGGGGGGRRGGVGAGEIGEV